MGCEDETPNFEQNPTRIHKLPQSKTQNNCSTFSFIIRNYLSQGLPREALVEYTRIRHKGFVHLGLVPLAFKACASLLAIRHGRAFHGDSIKTGVEFDIMVGTSLVDVYAKCGNIGDARKAFDYMPQRNVVTWNAIISGYSRNGDLNSASFLFEMMSNRTAVTWNEMIIGFARIGDTVRARQFFDTVPPELRTVVTWTVMVDGYSSNGEMEAARIIFEAMERRNYFVYSSMISGYCKNGNVDEARIIFDRIPVRNLVNWNSLISGYAQNGYCEEALEVYSKMKKDGFEPDEVTIACVLSACAQLGMLDFGKEIHKMVSCSKRIKLNRFVLNGLVDMYAKCGDLTNARLIFEGMYKRTYTCWNAMISGFAVNGQCEAALEFFKKMEESGEKPNDITFLSALSACAHGGFVKEGLEIFSRMEKYGLKAGVKHYGCLVDLFARAGRLKEAYGLLKTMPTRPNDTILGAFLGACRTHSDPEMANMVLEEISENGCGKHFVTLSSIYAASKSWERAERTRMEMMSKGFQKIPGLSSIMLGS